VMTGMGVGSSFDIDSTSVLVRVIKRAALAAAAAGDTTGRAQLEQFQQDLSNTLHRGVNIMQSIMAGLAGNVTWKSKPLVVELSSACLSLFFFSYERIGWALWIWNPLAAVRLRLGMGGQSQMTLGFPTFLTWQSGLYSMTISRMRTVTNRMKVFCASSWTVRAPRTAAAAAPELEMKRMEA